MKTGDYIYLCDQQFGIEPKDKTMVDSKAQALEEAIEISYRKGGLNASVQDSLSKGSVKNLIHVVLLLKCLSLRSREKEGKDTAYQCR